MVMDQGITSCVIGSYNCTTVEVTQMKKTEIEDCYISLLCFNLFMFSLSLVPLHISVIVNHPILDVELRRVFVPIVVAPITTTYGY